MNEAETEAKLPPPLIMRAITLATIFVSVGLFGLGQLNRIGIFPGPPQDSVTHRNNAKPTSEATFVESADGTKIRTTHIKSDGHFHFLYCGGNAEAPGHPDRNPIKSLSKFGDVLTFDYRNFGDTKGRATEAGLYQDARAVYAYGLRKLNWRPERVIVYGRSLGGAPAIRLTSDLLAKDLPDILKDGKPPAGLILEAPFTNIQQMGAIIHPWIPKPDWFALMHLDNLKRAPELTLPVLHYHGVDDQIIPFELGQELSDAMPRGARFLDLPETGHNNIWQQNKDLLNRQLEYFIMGLK